MPPTHRRKITITGKQITADLENQQVLVDVPDDGRDDRGDIGFTDLDGNALKHQWTDPGAEYATGSGTWNRNPSPRAIEHNGWLYFTMTSRSSAYLVKVNAKTGAEGHEAKMFTNDKDDHRTGAIVIRPDNRIVFFVTGHGASFGRYWISDEPEDITSFGEEHHLEYPEETLPDFTDSNAWLIDMGGGEFRCYYLFRGRRQVPGDTEGWSMMWSDDLTTCEPDVGATWTDPIWIFDIPQDSYVQTWMQDGRYIDCQVVDGTPATNPEAHKPSVFHCEIDGVEERINRSDGMLIRTLASFDNLTAIKSSELTEVYDAAIDGSAWNEWMGRFDDGRPAMLFSTSPSTLVDHFDTSENRHNWAVYEHGEWIISRAADAGDVVSPEGQPAGTGSAAFDPADPNRVFVSVEVDGNHEIRRLIRDEGSGEWAETIVTRENTQPQFRPLCPKNRVYAPEVMFNAGRFFNYEDYETRVRVWPAFESAYVRPSARVLIPSLKKEERYSFYMTSGGENNMGLQPEGADIWNANDLAVFDLGYTDPSHFVYYDSLGTHNATRTNGTIDQVAGEHGRAMHWDAEANDVNMPRKDLPETTELEVLAWVKTDVSGTGIRRTIFSNYDSTPEEPQFRLRTKLNSNVLEAHIVTEPDAVIGGEFADLVLTTGKVHRVILYFKAGVGLKVKLDETWSATVYATEAPMDATTPINRAFGVGWTSESSSERWRGDIHFVRLRNKLRTEAERSMDYVAWVDQSALLSFGPLEEITPRVPVPGAKVPHLGFPFRLVNGGITTVEQDSKEEIAACVEASARTPEGSRIDAPTYGIPDETFTQQTPNPSAEVYVSHITEDEPRARLIGEAEAEGLVKRIVLSEERQSV